MKRFFLIFFLILSLLSNAQLAGYGFFKVLTIQNSMVAGPGPHIDFPVLISHTDPDLRSTGNGGNVENINGYDIRFTASDGTTLLDHQVEDYDPVSGAFTAWVKVPSLSATIDTDIHIYYGNSSIVVDPSIETTWDANYQAVYHFENNFPLDDNSSNGNNLTNNGAGSNGSGAIEKSFKFSAGENVRVNSNPSFQISGDLTLSTWAQIDLLQAGANDNVLISCESTGLLSLVDNGQYTLNVLNDGRMRLSWEFGLIFGSETVTTTATVPLNANFNHYAVTRNVSTNTVDFYYNGVLLEGGIPYGNDPAGGTSCELRLAQNPSNLSNDFEGELDEVRISDSYRSAGWIQTSYNSMLNTLGSFYLMSVQMMPTPPPYWCWAEDALAGGNEEFLDLATDPVSGTSYAVGYFNGDISAEYPMGVNNTPDMSSTIGSQDGLIAKYDAQGNALWAFKIGNSGDNIWVTGVEIGAGGNIFICGYFNDNCNFAGVTGSPNTLLSGSDEDVFLASYDSNGNLLWVKQGTNSGEGVANDIAVNATNVYIVGWFESSITFDTDGNTPKAANDGVDTYVVGFNQTTGNMVWEQYAGDVNGGFTVNDRGYGIAADNNNVYITGTFTRTTEFDSNPAFQVTALSPGNRTSYLAEYDEGTGAIQWVGLIGATAGSGSCEAHALAVDVNNLYVAGSVEGNVSFPGGAPVVAVGGSAEELYACGINRTTKAMIWTEIAENNSGTDVIAEDIVTDGIGNIYVTGPFRGTTQFNGGLDPIISGGGEDFFVMKLNDVGTYVWTQTATDNNDLRGNGLGYDNFGGVYVAGLVTNQGTFGALPVLNDAGGDDAFISKINCTVPSCGPSITCPPNDTVTAGAGCTSILANYLGSETTIDGCGVGIASVVQSPAAGATLPAGTNEVDFIVTDNNANTDTCTMLVVVEANVNPVLVNCGDALVGQSTGGKGNNAGLFGCTATPTPGEDVYYQITVPAGNYLIAIGMDNVADANETKVNTFWVGGACPLGSGCLSTDTYDIGDQDFDSNNQNQLIYSAVGPGTYYFVVDSEIDSIDTYDISFDCIVSGIEFDESNCGLDVNNDGLHVTVDGSTTLDVNTCETVTICHTLYIENVLGGEWMDSVKFELGSCYTNITNITPIAPGPNGNYDLGGTWDAFYNSSSSTIDWGFNYSGAQPWGDGNWFVPTYTCGTYNFCFDATISSTCSNNNDLKIDIKVSDDGVNGVSSVSGFDFAVSSGFNILNPSPTISCPLNQVVNNDAGLCGAQVNGIAPTASGDNCPNPFITYTLTGATTGSGLNDASGNTFNLGVTTVQYMIEDSAGLKDSCQFTVTVNDATNPTLSCPTDLNISCPGVVNSIAPITPADNCGIDSVSYVLTGATTGSGLTDASGLSFNDGVTTVTYTVTDLSGNTATCNFTVTVNDATNPTLSCPTDLNISCPGVVNSIAPITPADNCGIDSVSYVLTGATTGAGLNDASGTFFSDGVTTVTYTVTDLSGNTASCNFTVTVNDATNPTLSCPTDVNISCPGVVNNIAPISPADNCGIDSVSYVLTGATTGSGLTDASGLSFNDGVTTVTYTVTDLSGNTASCNFTVTVNDATNPTLSCPTDVAISCPAVVNSIAPITPADNCGIDSVSYVLTGATTGSGLNDASGTFFNAGVTTVTYTVTDLSGNTANCNFTVTVSDAISPTIVCMGDVTEYLDLNCDFEIPDYTGTIVNLSDNCTDSSSILLSQFPTQGSIFSGHGLTQTITLYATDEFNNIDSCSFIVTLADTIAPTIACFGDTVVNTNTSCSFVLPAYNPSSVADNCTASGSILVAQSPIAGTTISTNTLVTLTADDGNGNVDSCSFNVILNDSINPTVICPNDTIVSNDLGSCDAFVTIGIPIANDNCGVSSVINNFNNSSNASDTYLLGTTAVSWIVTDNVSNTGTCSFNVTIIDVEFPEMTCISDTIINTDNGSCSALFTYNIVSLDNCSSTLTQTTGLTSGTVFPKGITANTYESVDLAGNVSTCSFNVTIIDNELPSIICPNDIIICEENITVSQPTINDNCGIMSLLNDFNNTSDASGVYSVGNTAVNWIVTDSSGNTNSCLMNIQRDELPSVAYAGEDQNVILNLPINFEANVPSVGSGVWNILSGNGTINNWSDAHTEVVDLMPGENIFTWTISNGVCPETYDEVVIHSLGLEIPTGFSPNGDNVNDKLVIIGIEDLASDLIIFNRWGVEVYSASNYQNDWDGTSNKGLSLPEDTYFYILKLTELAVQENGYIVLKR